MRKKRCLGILKPTKQRNFKGRIFGFDIETCNDNKEFVCASVWEDEDYVDPYNSVVTKKSWFFTNKRELINFFKTERFKNSVIAATNLGFDFFGTFEREEEIRKFRTLFRGSSLVFAKTWIRNREFSDKAYKINKRKKKYYGKPCSITFIDTFNYAKISVEKIGKILGFQKEEKPSFIGQRPKNKEEWELMKKYNLRDSEVSCRYIKFLYKSFEELGATPKITIASTSMSLFKNKYLNDAYFLPKTNIIKEIFQAYYGGRTEAFCRGKIEGYNYYDFNSLYPSVMRLEFPNPNSLRTTRRNNIQYVKDYEGVSKVDVYCPEMRYAFLPYRAKTKLLFPTGNFTGWYTHVELRKAMELGYVIKKVHKTHYFKEKCRPFKEYVEELYALRCKYKEEGNSMHEVVKLLLNSLYGKFGQKFEKRDNWEVFNHTKEQLDAMDDFEIIKGFIRIKKTSDPSSFCIPIWASYVTAYGRIKLYNSIIKCNPVYVDTDSLITKHELPISNLLGELKLEMTIKNGIIVKPKMYALHDENDEEHVKIKGIGKHLSMLEFKGLMVDPEISYKKFMKFKEAIRRGFITNEIVSITKRLNLNDDKRIWNRGFSPLFLDDSMPVRIIDGMTEHDYNVGLEKARLAFERVREAELKRFVNSDLFDRFSVGSDISVEEFLENEQDFREFE